jgi:predicted dehydrogenase
MQTKPLRYGYVGAGFVARFHLSAVRQIRGIEIVGVTAPKGARELAAMARELGVGEPKVFESIGEMAKHTDCIAIFAPNAARVPVMEEIVDAVKGGAELKGVICEKPLGRNIAEARRLVELAGSANLRTAYFYSSHTAGSRQ